MKKISDAQYPEAVISANRKAVSHIRFVRFAQKLFVYDKSPIRHQEIDIHLLLSNGQLIFLNPKTEYIYSVKRIFSRKYRLFPHPSQTFFDI